jgi:hypothetical protein
MSIFFAFQQVIQTKMFTIVNFHTSFQFQMKLIVFILWSRFKVDASNSIYSFTLFKFFKRHANIDFVYTVKGIDFKYSS